MANDSQGSGGKDKKRPKAVTLERLWDGVEEVVAGSHLFRSLDEDSRRELVEKGTVLVYPASRVILREGDAGSSFFLIDQGVVEVSTRVPAGNVPLATLQRGAFFGEVAMLTGLPRTATVMALTDVCVVRFEKGDIDAVLARNPDALRLLQAMVLGRAKDTAEKIARAAGDADADPGEG